MFWQETEINLGCGVGRRFDECDVGEQSRRESRKTSMPSFARAYQNKTNRIRQIR
jgi:hypothetical protein